MHREASTKFNVLAKGKTIQEYTNEELINNIITQTDLVTKEELIEFIDNYDLDLIEELDGAVDSLYVGVHLFDLMSEVKRRVANGVASQEDFKTLPMRRINFIMKLCNFVFENLPLDRGEDGELNYDLVEEASKRIIENNLSKFTTDQDDFEHWKAPEGAVATQREFEGETYYFFSQDGKVKKQRDFVPVQLGDFLEKFNGY
ncbi:MAG: hypothetical protein KBT03_00265 [Bacteroidales bacterium]|nr:hypothetical protein [Candidatus Scybalousia scybalohippi]